MRFIDEAEFERRFNLVIDQLYYQRRPMRLEEIQDILKSQWEYFDLQPFIQQMGELNLLNVVGAPMGARNMITYALKPEIINDLEKMPSSETANLYRHFKKDYPSRFPKFYKPDKPNVQRLDLPASHTKNALVNQPHKKATNKSQNSLWSKASKILMWLFNHLVQIIIGLIIAFIVWKLGWN